MTELPITECNLCNLQRLCFPDKLKKLSDDVGKLIQLRYLDLSFTAMEELPITICDLQNFQHLNLASGQLRRLPEDFGKLINLKCLSLQWNQYLGNCLIHYLIYITYKG